MNKHDPNPMKLGLALKAARLRRNLSQQEIAQVCKITTGAVSAIERGKNFPSLVTLAQMCHTYGESIDGLLAASPPGEPKNELL